MSTVTSDSRGLPGTIDITGTEPVPFGRLVKVESRKMLDTRSGFWLLVSTAILLLVAVGITLLVVALNEGVELDAQVVSSILAIPLSLLLPVFAIQSVTSEWSQRTALVSFTLEADRLRLLMAKLAAVVLLALSTIALATVLGLVLNVVAAGIGGYDALWNVDVQLFVATVTSQLLYFLMAFGIGMVMLSTPAAVALFYVVAMLLPFMVYSALYAIFEWAQDLIPWIDLQFASGPFFESWADVTGTQVAQLVVATTLWVVVPFVLGIRRVLASEPK